MPFTVTLGNLLEIAASIVAAVGIYVRLSERLTRVETKLDVLWERRQHPR